MAHLVNLDMMYSGIKVNQAKVSYHLIENWAY